MEVLEMVSNLVSTLGVPVACLAVTFYLWFKETENHRQESEKFIEAINNNTNIMQRILDRLDGNGETL